MTLTFTYIGSKKMTFDLTLTMPASQVCLECLAVALIWTLTLTFTITLSLNLTSTMSLTWTLTSAMTLTLTSIWSMPMTSNLKWDEGCPAKNKDPLKFELIKIQGAPLRDQDC